MIPWMERKFQQLDAQISQSRKGLKNQIKYLWRSGKTHEGEEGSAGPGVSLKRALLRQHTLHRLGRTQFPNAQNPHQQLCHIVYGGIWILLFI